MKTIYKNESFAFARYTIEENGQTQARIIRHSLNEAEEEVAIFDYMWPAQLTVEAEAGDGLLREDGTLCWEMHVTAHHISGMVQGEFTETEYFAVESPFGNADELICKTVDIVRKTRFALAERHLKHLPHQTYPPIDGKQGPYGHP